MFGNENDTRRGNASEGQAAKHAADAEGGQTAGDPVDATSEASTDRLRVLQAEKDDLLNTLVRRQADFENYRKRIERERQQDRHRGVEVLIEKLLPMLDAFERALKEPSDAVSAEYRRGFELIYKQLSDVLEKQGLERIEATGKEFDPNLHHAIEKVESTDYPDHTVMTVFQAGYKFHNKVVRPAMVRVAVHPATVS